MDLVLKSGHLCHILLSRSRPQILARSHPNLLKTSQAMLSLFGAEPEDEVSLSTPVSYADRLRIRLPGDAKFALGREFTGQS
jgi:hypothetical protein